MAKVMDEATRRKLSGLLPFAPGSYARVKLEIFDGVDPEFVPVFFLRAASSETMAAYRLKAEDKSASTCDAFRDLLADGALVGWENFKDLATGEDVKFSKDSIKALILDPLAAALFAKVMEFTYGPTAEEKTGLESLPLPTPAD
jgi:hypothetical protein